MSRWDSLSIRERGTLFKEFLKLGIRDLGKIREYYNTFSEGGDVDNDPNLQFKQDAVRMPSTLARLPKQQVPYSPNIGEIRSDDRGAIERFFDRVATNYNTSTFGNSAVADVLSSMTPYGLIHEGLGGNTSGALMSIVPFGAEVSTGTNVAKAALKRGSRVLSRNAQRSRLEIPTFEDRELLRSRDLTQAEEVQRIREQFIREARARLNNPEFNERAIIWHPQYKEELEKNLDRLSDPNIVVVNTEDFTRLTNYISKYEGPDYVEPGALSLKNVREAIENIRKDPRPGVDLEDFINLLRNYENRILMPSLEKPYYMRSLATQALHEFLHKLFGANIDLVGNNFKDLVKNLTPRKEGISPSNLMKELENPNEIIPRLEALRRALLKKGHLDYLDGEGISMDQLKKFYDIYTKKPLYDNFKRFKELKSKTNRTPREEYLLQKYKRARELNRDFLIDYGISKDANELLDNYELDENLLNLINNAPPLKFGGSLKKL